MGAHLRGQITLTLNDEAVRIKAVTAMSAGDTWGVDLVLNQTVTQSHREVDTIVTAGAAHGKGLTVKLRFTMAMRGTQINVARAVGILLTILGVESHDGHPVRAVM